MVLRQIRVPPLPGCQSIDALARAGSAFGALFSNYTTARAREGERERKRKGKWQFAIRFDRANASIYPSPFGAIGADRKEDLDIDSG